MSAVRAESVVSERERLDNLALLRPVFMMEVWSAREKVVRPRSDVVRREVHSVEVEWCISADAVESGTPIPENFTGRERSLRRSAGIGVSGSFPRRAGRNTLDRASSTGANAGPVPPIDR